MSLSFIPFHDSIDIKIDSKKHQALLRHNRRFGGPCDLICNRILLDNILGAGNDVNFLKDRITVGRINQEGILNGHFLKVYSTFKKVIGFLFRIYPDNIFSVFNQWKLVNQSRQGNSRKVNRKILSQALKNILEGESLKLEVFRRTYFAFDGHSLLFKKTLKNTYVFFNSNEGESRHLSFQGLCDKIDEQLMKHRGNDIFIFKGEDYLMRLREKLGREAFERLRLQDVPVSNQV